jgi:dipeptidyl aminopeptidase/acylaminoacyl peptidase
MRRALLLAVPLLAVLAVPVRAAGGPPCVDRTGPVPISVDGDGGYVAYPDKKPVGLVVFFHGINHTAQDWAVHHLERVATESRVVAVAMDYPGYAGPGAWQVQEGATASIAAAEQLKAQCRTVRTTVAYGVSMGGNASGLALADAPVGLFDWWFAVEGAHNVIETYVEASAVALSGNQTAVDAKAGIEEEMGGTLVEAPDAYRQHTNVFRAEEIAASGIQGVFMVHGLADGLVPYDQSREMAALLRGLGQPVEFVTATLRGEGEPGTTADGYVPTGQTSPFAGHANENSTTHVVGAEGFARLRALLDGVLIVDGERTI